MTNGLLFWIIGFYAYWCLYYAVSKANPGLSIGAKILLTIRSLVPPADAIIQAIRSWIASAKTKS